MCEEGPLDSLLTDKKRQIATGMRDLEIDIWTALLDFGGLRIEELIRSDTTTVLFAETQMAKSTSAGSYPELIQSLERLNVENQDMNFSAIMEDGIDGPVCAGIRIDRIRDGSHVDGEDGPMDMLLAEKHAQIDAERRNFPIFMSFALLNFAGCHLTSLAKYGRADIPFGELGYSEYALRRLRPLLPAYVDHMNRTNRTMKFSIVEGEAGGMGHAAIRISVI